MIIERRNAIRGEITVPGDKSISHRAIMLGSVCEGTSRIEGFLNGADCISTMNCFREMGVDIEYDGETSVVVHGVGLHGLKKPDAVLYCGNSGTTTRIMSGLLCGAGIDCIIDGDESIRRRPMKRIITPLSMMGADITSERDNGCAPLRIGTTKLHGICYDSPVASAQVKSSILMAALYADSETSVSEPALSRDHTERMLMAMGADIEAKGKTVRLDPGNTLYAQDITVPGDISSAAYFMGAALIIPGSDILIRNVGINPTRSGIIDVFRDMGGKIELLDKRVRNKEEIADIRVRYSELKGTEIGGDVIPTLIDELPLIAVVASRAKGRTVIKDASELKVKESDRIALVAGNLRAMGGDIIPADDGFIINSTGDDPGEIRGAVIDDAKDHRIAMSFTVAGLAARGETVIENPDCVSISYPGFFRDIMEL